MGLRIIYTLDVLRLRSWIRRPGDRDGNTGYSNNNYQFVMRSSFAMGRDPKGRDRNLFLISIKEAGSFVDSESLSFW
jgi:hypothetical protein